MRTSKVFWGVAMVAAIIAASIALPAGARAQEQGQKAAVPRVQIPSLMAPIVKADGRRAMAPLTIIMQVGNAEEVKKFCWMLPRIQDAVMQVLYAHQIRQLANGELDVADLRKELTAAANKSLGSEIVHNAEIYEGMRSGGSGGAKFAGWQMCRDISKSKSE